MIFEETPPVIKDDRQRGIAPLKGVNVQDPPKFRRVSPFSPEEWEELKNTIANYDHRKIGQYLDNASTGGASTALTGFGESRYDKNILSFDDFDDLNQLRAINQSGFMQVLNGLANMGTKAVGTFTDGIVGTVGGLVNASYKAIANGEMTDFWEDFVNNPVSLYLNSVMDDVSKGAPIYLSNQYRENQEEGFWKNMATPEFWGIFLDNAGFTLGMAGSAAITGGLTGAISGSTRVAGSIAKAARTIAKTEKATTALGNLSRKAREAKIAAQILNGERVLYGFDVPADIARQVRQLKFRGGVQSLIGSTLAASAEGRFEGIQASREFVELQEGRLYSEQGQRELKAKTLEQLRQTLQREPNEEEYQVQLQLNEELAEAAIDRQADRVARTVAAWNIPLLTASNLLVWGKLFSPKLLSPGNKITSPFTNAFSRVRKVVDEGGKMIGAEIKKSPARTAGRVANAFARQALKAGVEGSEEMMQGAVAAFGKKHHGRPLEHVYTFAGRQYDPAAKTEIDGYFSELGKSIAEQWSTTRNWEEFAYGAITSLLGVPRMGRWSRGNRWDGGLVKGISEARKEHDRITAAVDAINKRVQDPAFRAYYHGMIRHNAFQQKMDRAAVEEDVFDFKNNEYAQFISDVILFDKVGRVNWLKDTVDDEIATLERMQGTLHSDETRAERRDYVDQLRAARLNVGTATRTSADPFVLSDLDGKTDEQVVKEALERQRKLRDNIDKYATIANNVQQLFGNNRMFTDDEHQELTYLVGAIGNFEERAASIVDNLKKTAGELGLLDEKLSFDRRRGIINRTPLTTIPGMRMDETPDDDGPVEMTLREFFDAFSGTEMLRVLTSVDEETGKGPKNLLDKILNPDVFNMPADEFMKAISGFKALKMELEIAKGLFDAGESDETRERYELKVKEVNDFLAKNFPRGTTLSRDFNDLVKITLARDQLVRRLAGIQARPESVKEEIREEKKDIVNEQKEKVVDEAYEEMTKEEQKPETERAEDVVAVSDTDIDIHGEETPTLDLSSTSSVAQAREKLLAFKQQHGSLVSELLTLAYARGRDVPHVRELVEMLDLLVDLQEAVPVRVEEMPEETEAEIRNKRIMRETAPNVLKLMDAYFNMANTREEFETLVANNAREFFETLGIAIGRRQESEEDRIQEDNRRFNEELQQQIEGTLPAGHIYSLGMPGPVLQSVGMPESPIELAAERLEEKASEEYRHQFELSEIKDLPGAIQNPLMVFAYGDKTKAVNIITETERDGKKFLVGISMNPVVKGKVLEVNSIRTIFPKDTSEWLNWINQGKGLYFNKEKVLDFLTNSGHPADVAFGFPGDQVQQEETGPVNLKERDNLAGMITSATNIIKKFQNPPLPGEKNISHPLEQEARDFAGRFRAVVIIKRDDEYNKHDSSKKRKSKGYYNPKTGEVVINIDKATSVEDLRKTILHELVGHKGLREIIGKEHYDAFMRELYNRATPEIRQAVDDLAKRRGYGDDIALSMDEYMAELAQDVEQFDSEQASLWEHFVNWLKEVFGLTEIDGNALRELIVMSYNNLSYQQEVDRSNDRIYNEARTLINDILANAGIDRRLGEINESDRTRYLYRVPEQPAPAPAPAPEQTPEQQEQQQQRERTALREAYKKVFKKGGEKIAQFLHEKENKAYHDYGMKFLQFLDEIIADKTGALYIIEKNHSWLVAEYMARNPAVVEEKKEEEIIPDPYELLASRGYKLQEHTMNNGKAVALKFMYRDQFVPSGITDPTRDLDEDKDNTNSSVICYFNNPDSRLADRFVFTVEHPNALNTPTAFELADNPSLMTPEWEQYLEENGRKRDDGTYNLAGLLPDFNDPHSLSFLMIRIYKGGVHDIEIISRYNHFAFMPDGGLHRLSGEPNATLDRKPNKIMPGLKESLFHLKNLKKKSNSDFVLDQYTIQDYEGKLYHYFFEENGVYFGQDFFIDTNVGGSNVHRVRQDREVLIGLLLIDRGKIIDPKGGNRVFIRNVKLSNDRVSFEKTTGKPEPGEEEVFARYILTRNKAGEWGLEIKGPTYDPRMERVIRDFRPTSLVLHGLQNVGNNFFSENRTLKSISLPDARKIGDYFIANNTIIENVDLPNVEEIGSSFLYNARRLSFINLPKVKSVGDYFLNLNGATGMIGLTSIDFPELETVGEYFIQSNARIERVNLPKLKQIDSFFMISNEKIVHLSLPSVTEIRNLFMINNVEMKTIDLPEVENIGNDFLSNNTELQSINAPKLEVIKGGFLRENITLKEISLPSLRTVGRHFLNNNSYLSILDIAWGLDDDGNFRFREAEEEDDFIELKADFRKAKDFVEVGHFYGVRDMEPLINRFALPRLKELFYLIEDTVEKVNPRITFWEIPQVKKDSIRLGSYFAANVVINKDLLEWRQDLIPYALVHELIHSVTADILDGVRSSDPNVLNLLTPSQKEAADKLVELWKKADKHLGHRRDGYYYGLTDAKEFIAELSNSVFVGILSRITEDTETPSVVVENRSILQKIISWIRELLGIRAAVPEQIVPEQAMPDPTIPEQVEEILKELIANPVGYKIIKKNKKDTAGNNVAIYESSIPLRELTNIDEQHDEGQFLDNNVQGELGRDGGIETPQSSQREEDNSKMEGDGSYAVGWSKSGRKWELESRMWGRNNRPGGISGDKGLYLGGIGERGRRDSEGREGVSGKSREETQREKTEAQRDRGQASPVRMDRLLVGSLSVYSDSEAAKDLRQGRYGREGKGFLGALEGGVGIRSQVPLAEKKASSSKSADPFQALLSWNKKTILDNPGAEVFGETRFRIAGDMETSELSLDKIINEKGEIDYEQLGKTTSAIENQRAHINRLTREEERGRLQGGKRNVEASIIALAERSRSLRRLHQEGDSGTSRGETTGLSRPVPGEGSPEERDRIAQEEALVAWAKHRKIFFTDKDIPAWGKMIDFGSEAFVFHGETPGKVRKIVNPSVYSASPVEFLDNRVSLHNYHFPDTAYKLVGVFLGATAGMELDKTKQFAFVLEQDYIVGRSILDFSRIDPDTPARFKRHMEDNGFVLEKGKKGYAYFNRDVAVRDLHDQNVIIGYDIFHVIDAVIALNTPEESANGNRSYGNGEIITDDNQIRYRNDEKMNTNKLSLQRIINEKGEIDYEQLKKTVDAIRDGRARFNRLLEGIEKSRFTGGRRNVEAAAIALSARPRGLRSQDQNGDSSTLRQEREAQEKALFEWARHEGILVDHEEIVRSWGNPVGYGREAIVFKEKDGKVKKLVDPYYALETPFKTPARFIDDRIALFNYYFPETAYSIVGITKTQSGKLMFILEQRYIEGRSLDDSAHDDPTVYDEFRDLMESVGFIHSKEHGTLYFDNESIIKDLHGQNVLKSRKGNFFIIDAILSLNTPDQPFGGTREYGNGNIIIINNNEGTSNEQLERTGDRDKAGLDYRRTVGVSPLDWLVGEREESKREREGNGADYIRTSDSSGEAFEKRSRRIGSGIDETPDLYEDDDPFVLTAENAGDGWTSDLSLDEEIPDEINSNDQDNEIIRYREDYEQQSETPGMGNAGAMGSNAIQELLGKTERDGRILETVTASYIETGNERTKAVSRDPEENKFRYLERLKKEAIKRGTWIEDIRSITEEGKIFARGAENTVYLSKDKENVIKVNNLMFGLTFEQVVERFALHNRFFGKSVPYRLVGFTDNEEDYVSFVLEQPYVQNPTPASNREIANALRKMGFKKSKHPTSRFDWEKDNTYGMWDADSRNVIKGENGELYFIDVVIQPMKPEDVYNEDDDGDIRYREDDLDGIKKQIQEDYKAMGAYVTPESDEEYLRFREDFSAVLDRAFEEAARDPRYATVAPLYKQIIEDVAAGESRELLKQHGLSDPNADDLKAINKEMVPYVATLLQQELRNILARARAKRAGETPIPPAMTPDPEKKPGAAPVITPPADASKDKTSVDETETISPERQRLDSIKQEIRALEKALAHATSADAPYTAFIDKINEIQLLINKYRDPSDDRLEMEYRHYDLLLDTIRDHVETLKAEDFARAEEQRQLEQEAGEEPTVDEASLAEDATRAREEVEALFANIVNLYEGIRTSLSPAATRPYFATGTVNAMNKLIRRLDEIEQGLTGLALSRSGSPVTSEQFDELAALWQETKERAEEERENIRNLIGSENRRRLEAREKRIKDPDNWSPAANAHVEMSEEAPKEEPEAVQESASTATPPVEETPAGETTGSENEEKATPLPRPPRIKPSELNIGRDEAAPSIVGKLIHSAPFTNGMSLYDEDVHVDFKMFVPKDSTLPLRREGDKYVPVRKMWESRGVLYSLPYLRQMNAFDYVDSGNVRQGDEVYVMYDPAYWLSLISHTKTIEEKRRQEKYVADFYPLLLVVPAPEGSDPNATIQSEGRQWQVVGTFSWSGDGEKGVESKRNGVSSKDLFLHANIPNAREYYHLDNPAYDKSQLPAPTLIRDRFSGKPVYAKVTAVSDGNLSFNRIAIRGGRPVVLEGKESEQNARSLKSIMTPEQRANPTFAVAVEVLEEEKGEAGEELPGAKLVRTYVDNVGGKIGKNEDIAGYDGSTTTVPSRERLGQAFFLVQSPANPGQYIPAEVLPKHLGEGRFDLDGQTTTARGIREGIRQLTAIKYNNDSKEVEKQFERARDYLGQYVYLVNQSTTSPYMRAGVNLQLARSARTNNYGLLFNIYDEDGLPYNKPSRQEVIRAAVASGEGYISESEEALAKKIRDMLVKLNVHVQVPLIRNDKGYSVDEAAMKRLVEDDALETNLESTRLRGVFFELSELQTGQEEFTRVKQEDDDTRLRPDDSIIAEPKEAPINLKDFSRQLAGMERMLARPYRVTNDIKTQKRLNILNHCKKI